jgi:hypothetical protein
MLGCLFFLKLRKSDLIFEVGSWIFKRRNLYVVLVEINYILLLLFVDECRNCLIDLYFFCSNIFLYFV